MATKLLRFQNFQNTLSLTIFVQLTNELVEQNSKNSLPPPILHKNKYNIFLNIRLIISNGAIKIFFGYFQNFANSESKSGYDLHITKN